MPLRRIGNFCRQKDLVLHVRQRTKNSRARNGILRLVGASGATGTLVAGSGRSHGPGQEGEDGTVHCNYFSSEVALNRKMSRRRPAGRCFDLASDDVAQHATSDDRTAFANATDRQTGGRITREQQRKSTAPTNPVYSRQRMGNCCAFLKSAGAVDGSSVEMKQRKGGADGGGKAIAPSLTISRRMSAPSVAIDGEMVVSGAWCIF